MPKVKDRSIMSLEIEHENGEVVRVTDTLAKIKQQFAQYVYCLLIKRYERVTVSLLDCANRVVKQFKQVI